MSSAVGHALAGALCAKGIRPSVEAVKEKWLVLLAGALARTSVAAACATLLLYN